MLTRLRPGIQMGIGFSILMVLFGFFVVSLQAEISHIKKLTSQALNRNLAIVEETNSMRDAVNGVWQWLTDISATRGLDGLNDGFEKASGNAAEFKKRSDVLQSLFEKNGDTKSVNDLNEIRHRFNAFYETGKIMAHAYVDGGPAEGNGHMGNFDTVAELLFEGLNPFVSHQKEELALAMSQSSEAADEINRLVYYLSIPFALVSVILSIVLSRSISGYIRRPLLGVIQKLNQNAGHLANASQQVQSASQMLAEGSSEQAASVEETNATLTEIAAMAEANSNTTRDASSLASQAQQLVGRGGDSMKSLVNVINEIKDASDKTAQINRTIDEIAFQTNLLALNAAVEAARAGDAGKGFAVVAEEVRNLALRSATAAKNTTEIIESSVIKAGQGVASAQDMEKLLNDINGIIHQVTDTISSISDSSQEQTVHIQQVNQSSSQMEGVIQSTAANAEQSSASAEELTSLAHSLLETVAELEALAETTNMKKKMKEIELDQARNSLGNKSASSKELLEDSSG